MPRKLRFLPEPDELVLITTRVLHGLYLLRPSAELNRLVIGVLLLAFELLFPPFKWSALGTTWAAKHSFILTPPASLDLTVGLTPAVIDTGRWIAHGLSLIGATGIAFLLFRSWRDDAD